MSGTEDNSQSVELQRDNQHIPEEKESSVVRASGAPLAGRAMQSHIENQQIATTPADIVKYAMETKADLPQIRELMTLQKEWEAHEAKKTYNLAMAGFKSEHIEIEKDQHVEFRTSGGDLIAYDHSSLYGMVKATAPRMGEYGLSHRFDVDQSDTPLIKVTCIITHKQGHSESITLSAGADSSGKKNAIQQVASTIKYLSRYAYEAILGLASKDLEDDGRLSEDSFEEVPEIDPRHDKLVFDLEYAAAGGWDSLQLKWQSISNEERNIVGNDFGRIKKIAEKHGQ